MARIEPDAPLALVCSVRLECAELTSSLRPDTIGRKPAWRGELEGMPVVLLQCGMGKTNAAQALTALLERQPVRGVLGFGVAGAYPGSGLEVGEVALATAAIYADEGVEGPEGWMGTEGIGIPLLERDGERWYNEFPTHPGALQAAVAALTRGGLPVRAGPFLTVSCCSGTSARGSQLAVRWGAWCEGMEGAALAHVATLYDAPYLELRGISNRVEDRDLSSWRLAEAAEAAQQAVRRVAAAWPQLS